MTLTERVSQLAPKYTAKVIATMLEIDADAVRAICARNNIKLKYGSRKEAQYTKVYELYKQFSGAEIGRIIGISRQRVSFMINQLEKYGE